MKDAAIQAGGTGCGAAYVRLLPNPAWRPGPPAPPMDQASLDAAAREIAAWPEYRPTPAIALPGLAAQAGFAAILCKHEGHRFAVGSFKAVGPPLAALRLATAWLAARGIAADGPALLSGAHRDALAWLTLSAATSGNHGRALAWVAQRIGCRCAIYMDAQCSAGREAAIARFGARIIRVDGPYDAAVERAERDMAELGHIVVSTLPPPGFPDVPVDIMRGYAVVGRELLAADPALTHIFVGGGGGRFAAAISAAAALHARARVVVVEPSASHCLMRSAERGAPATVPPSRSVMDGLVVGRASPFGWPVLQRHAFAFLAVPDSCAVAALAEAAEGRAGDPRLAIGETGIAGWAGFLAARRDPAIAAALGLDAASRIAIIASEGATDPEVYRRLTGHAPQDDSLESAHVA